VDTSALTYYSDWNGWPETGHFFGGAHFSALETALPSLLCGVTLSSPEYDPAVTGLGRKESWERNGESGAAVFPGKPVRPNLPQKSRKTIFT